MAASYVKCLYCNTSFDKHKELYVKPRSNRYAHAECYLREKVKNPQLANLPVVDPTDEVECYICKKKFFKSKTADYLLISDGKYAHKECLELESKRELTDKEKLDKFILQLYDLTFVPPRVQKQVKEYAEKYNYSYSGMMKTLEYMYAVKGLNVDKTAFNTYGIALIKSYYDRAHDYYYSIWEAQQNQNRVLESYSLETFIPKTVEINIPLPKRKELKRQLFSFLDEEEETTE